MKAILLLFDSLNRHHIPPYGCDWCMRRTALGRHSVTFDTALSGACPACPRGRAAHRRYNFLHRSWVRWSP